MEDCIDTFMHKLARGDADQPGIIKKMSRKIKKLWARHQVANQIQELSDRVKDVSERRSRYKLDECIVRSATPVAIDPRLPVLLAESKGLIGVDGPRDTITGWLMDGEPQLKVVSIVGFGGLGKTTLVMEVYRSLGGQFHYKAAASVSRNLDLKKLTKDALSQLLQEHERGQFGRLEVEQLIRTLRDYLQDKKYL
ncbi:disease resistance protein RPM1-like [Setaria italica]|uniref:disease resistance protein RPM1-like n=1 Tax=Setaria italica TaxID=4555 RepID=UPI0006483C98|nr:disease resistance protein RPM1-like [Setaria italica]